MRLGGMERAHVAEKVRARSPLRLYHCFSDSVVAGRFLMYPRASRESRQTTVQGFGVYVFPSSRQVVEDSTYRARIAYCRVRRKKERRKGRRFQGVRFLTVRVP